jgi:hypothetical protein
MTGTPRCREDDYATQRGGGSTHSVPSATWSGTVAFLVRRRGHVSDIYFPSSATLRVDNTTTAIYPAAGITYRDLGMNHSTSALLIIESG